MASREEILTALGLSTEQLQAILAQGNGRSPIKPRQLNDLRRPPSAQDPRPLFIPSAEAPIDVPERHLPYPKLLWSLATGAEITVYDAEEHRAKLAGDYTEMAPTQAPLDPVARARELFDALNEEDQALVLEAQRQARISAVTAAMGGLSANQAAEAIGAPVKRGPGRPRKEVVA